MTLPEFQLLLSAFTQAYDRRYPIDQTLDGGPRQRFAGGDRKGVLYRPEQKLLFLLVHLKTYPLQAVMAELFALSQPGVNYWLHRLLPILQSARDDVGVRPARDPRCFAARPSSAGKVRLVLDGTERRRPRPKSPEKQALHYSGKKKTPCDKNGVLLQVPSKRLGFGSRTYVGKTHDKKIADQEAILDPVGTERYKDTGFQGYEPTVKRSCQPKKSPLEANARPLRSEGTASWHAPGEGGACTRGRETLPHRKGRFPEHQRGRIGFGHGSGLWTAQFSGATPQATSEAVTTVCYYF
ncbi:MAG TPA: transposase family protein [Gemmataceae bacterium]|nr:transposase family protein [Gemmataceae bacterium]